MRFACKTIANFEDCTHQKFFVCFVHLLLIFVGETLINRTIFNVNVVDESGFFVVVMRNTKHVYIAYGVTNHLAFGNERGNQFVLFFKLLGFFKAHFFCQLHHLFVENSTGFAHVSFENLFGLGNLFIVIFHSLLANAGP